MDRANLKTFDEWSRAGRKIIKGQSAEHYLLSPDGRDGRALFSIDQTTEGGEPELIADWTLIVPAAQKPPTRRTQQASDGSTKIKILYDPESKIVRVWAGPNKALIKLLKRGNYHYDGRTHRWSAKREDIDGLVQSLEQYAAKKELDWKIAVETGQ